MNTRANISGWNRHAWFAVSLCVLALLAGCRQKPADLRQTIAQAEQAARKAYEAKEPQAASQAAERAEKALARLEAIAKEAPAAEKEPENLLSAARQSAQTARLFAELAREEDVIRDRLDRLRVKAYRAARNTLCELGFSPFVPLLQQAATNHESLNPVNRQLAEQAWNLASLLTGRQVLTNDQPDWAGAARDVKSWTTNPPPPVGLFLSAALQLSGFPTLSLFEIESARPATNAPPVLLLLSHAQRAILYDWQGLPHLATQETERALALSTNAIPGAAGPQLTAILHLYFAGRALQKLEFSKADAQLSRAIALWPDNLLTLLVKAEKLAAQGQWQQAADFLETQAAVPARDDWTAKKLRQRARELRAGQAQARPLVDDKWLFLETLWSVAASTVSESGLGNQWRGFMDSALEFGKKLTEQLPGGKEEPDKTEKPSLLRI